MCLQRSGPCGAAAGTRLIGFCCFCGAAVEAWRKPVGEVPFSVTKPPVVIRAKAQKIDRGFEDGYDTVCAKVPTSTAPLSAPEEIELHPYGCAKLRMTELPLADGAVFARKTTENEP